MHKHDLDLAEIAKERGIKYFLISYTDLFGASAPSWCRPRRSAGMQKAGAVSPASPPGST
jgi:hypothetical protein